MVKETYGHGLRLRLMIGALFWFALLAGIAAFAQESASAPAPSYRDEVMLDGPRAYWRLGETSGTKAADETANRNTGSYQNGVLLGQPGALLSDTNRAAGFDGVNDTVRVGNSATLSPTAALSLEAWVSPTSATLASVIRKGQQYMLRTTADRAAICGLRKSTTVRELTTPAGLVTTGSWHQLACTWDGATIRIYVDGTERASGALAAPIDSTSTALSIGSDANSGERFKGTIDEVAVYPGALSAQRVQTHYSVARTDSIAPTVTLSTPAQGSSTNDATPTFSGRAGTALGDSTSVTVEVYSGTAASGTPVQTLTATPNGTGAWSVDATAALAEGTYTARAEQTDDSGNTGVSATSTFSVDTTPPAVTLATPASGSATQSATPTFSGSAGTAAGDGTAVTVRVYAGTSASGTALQTLTATRGATGSWSVAASAPLADGTYTAIALQSDAAGNGGSSAANTFAVDAAAPAITLTTPSNGTSTNDPTPTFSGRAGTATGDSATVTVSVYAGTSASGTAVQVLSATRDAAGSWSVDPASPLAEGTYTAKAEQVDGAGNVGASAAATFTVDTTAPAITLTSPPSGSSTDDAAPTFAGTAGAGPTDLPSVTVEVYNGTTASGTPVRTLTATRGTGGSWSVDLSSPLAQGTYTALAAQSDVAGNTGRSAPSTFDVVATVSVPYRSEVLADAPRGYWRLGEQSGATALDETGAGLNGTYLNGVALGRPGALLDDSDTAAAFDGTNDTVRIAPAAALNPTAALTLEAWVKPSASIQSSLIRKDGQYMLRLRSDGRIACRIWQGGLVREATTSTTVPNNSWHQVVCTYDGAALIAYIDGAAKASLAASGSIDSTSRDLYLGSAYDSYDYLAGSLDEAAVYDTALPAARVLAHYARAGDTAAPSVGLSSPASDSRADTVPSFGGKAGTASGDSATVAIKIYSGPSVFGVLVGTANAAVQPAGTYSVLAPAALPSGTYTAQTEQTDTAGNVGRSAPTTFTVDDTADPQILAAGDIAACDTFGDEATADVLDRLPGTVVPLGDSVYEYGTASDFANCYDPTWGRQKARTRPMVGGHEYLTAGATPYYNYFGAAAGDPAKGYYSYDLGGWHIVVLNAICSQIGGCGESAPETKWLRSDLAAHPAACTLATMHTPRFSSGVIHGSDPTYWDWWKALREAGAEVVLSGDEHFYERFAPQTEDGVADPNGLREFVLGTGGRSHYDFAGTITANSEARNNDSFGVLKLTLHSAGYDWQFVPEAGKTFGDSGSSSCH